jgi:hypothetical protein
MYIYDRSPPKMKFLDIKIKFKAQRKISGERDVERKRLS